MSGALNMTCVDHFYFQPTPPMLIFETLAETSKDDYFCEIPC